MLLSDCIYGGYMQTLSVPNIDLERIDEPSPFGTELTAVSNLAAIQLTPRGLRAERMGNTRTLIDRIAALPEYIAPRPGDTHAPHGRFRGRQIIGSGAAIRGGVYMGRGPREAIVVDLEPGTAARFLYEQLVLSSFAVIQPQWTKVWRHNLLHFFLAIFWLVPPDEDDDSHVPLSVALPRITSFVQQHMPYSDALSAEVARRLKAGKDEEVSIDEYIRATAGVCRHQVCLLGGLLEQLIEAGHIAGSVSIERDLLLGGSHAWVRFTAPGGQAYILDPAQNVLCMRLQDMHEGTRAFYDKQMF